MFKKLFWILILILPLSSSCNSMIIGPTIIEMPNKAELKKLFTPENQLLYAVEINIISSLAGEKTFFEIKTIINREIKSYYERLGEYTDLREITRTKEAVYEIIYEMLENKPKVEEAFRLFIEYTNNRRQ